MIKPITIALIVLLLLVIALIVVFLRIKKLKKEEKIERGRKQTLEKSITLEGKAQTPRESLVMLSHIAKKFFKEYLNEKKEMTYLEMAEKLKTKKAEKMAEFSEKMDYFLYSGIEISKESALRMINEFSEIVKSRKK